MNTRELPWLAPLAEWWRGAAARGRLPHAVLLTGTPGVGKRAAAAWIAKLRLGIESATGLPEYRPGPQTGVDQGEDPPREYPGDFPDLYWVRPLHDEKTDKRKKIIGIDQVRELVAELSLTSHQGGCKVAIIEPANLMTVAAANSLLKTLEEPPGEALLLLVADRLGNLPPTIVSRCQRLNIPTPPEHVSLEWLDRLQPATNWPAALHMAGNAPLAAIEARGRLDLTDTMARDFAQLAEGRVSPLEVAARWCRQDPDFVLGWLGRQVQQCVHRVTRSGAQFDTCPAETVLNRIDRRNLFCYLDAINRVRSQPAGSYNVQLTLESLLIDWGEGLRNCGNKFIRGGLLPIPDGKVDA